MAKRAEQLPLLQLLEQVKGLQEDEAQGTLRERLTAIAVTARHLTGCAALAIALDSAGDPLAAGEAGLGLVDRQGDAPARDLERMTRLVEALPGACSPAGGWELLDQPGIAGGGLRLRAFTVPPRGPRRGLVLLDSSRMGKSWTVHEPLTMLCSLADLIIRDAIQSKALQRSRSLQDLALRLPYLLPLTQDARTSGGGLAPVVQALRGIFDAAAVSVFLQLPAPNLRLRFAGSTDEPLVARANESPIEYEPGRGLTGHVFENGRPLRLVNALDRAEIERKTPLRDRAGPTHTEQAVDGNAMLQFLGVPIREGERPLGVLRMTRAAGREHFNAEDEAALQFFADLLGLHLTRIGEAQRAQRIWQSTSEAIVQSMHERWGTTSIHAITDVNPGAESLLGADSSSLLGYDPRLLYSEHSRAQVRQGLLDHQPVYVEIVTPSEARLPVEIAYHQFWDHRFQPAIHYTLGIARPSHTGELQEYQLLQRLLADLRLVYFRTDTNGRRITRSRVEAELTGYTESELYTKDVSDLFANPADAARLVDEARQSGGLVRRRLLWLRKKGDPGEEFPIEADFRVHFGADGRVEGREGLYREVSRDLASQGILGVEDQSRVYSREEIIEWARVRMDQAPPTIDYLSSVGHQLKIPLIAMRQTLRNFQEGLLTGEALSQEAAYVLGQSRVCIDLVTNLSYMGKILSGERLKFDSRPVSLAVITRQVKQDFFHLLTERKIYLYYDEASLDRICQVSGSHELLRQVVVNLVHNAIKYSHSDTEITVIGAITARGPVYEISNEGIPIPEELRERIFERGIRAPTAEDRDPSGTGLGLWLCRKILDRHGFRIRCDVVARKGKVRNVFQIILK